MYFLPEANDGSTLATQADYALALSKLVPLDLDDDGIIAFCSSEAFQPVLDLWAKYYNTKTRNLTLPASIEKPKVKTEVGIAGPSSDGSFADEGSRLGSGVKKEATEAIDLTKDE